MPVVIRRVTDDYGRALSSSEFHSYFPVVNIRIAPDLSRVAIGLQVGDSWAGFLDWKFILRVFCVRCVLQDQLDFGNLKFSDSDFNLIIDCEQLLEL
jgi:hypothetical protein